MSLSCTIAGVSVNIQSISRPDTIDQKTQCTIVVLDSAGTAFYQRGMPVTITDSILGSIFTGCVHSPKMTPLYPNPHKRWTIDCIQIGDYLAGKRTSNKTYANQYAGTIAVDQVQRYGAPEGLTANAALRWDELLTDWQAGTLANTVATTNASDGNPGDGDLELALSGAQVVVSGSGAGFALGAGLLFTGYASSGYTNAYVYRQIWNGSQTISNGQADYLTYDMWIASSSPQMKAGVDFICTDGTTLRDSVALDVQGLSPHPNSDTSGLANDQWYSRIVYMPSSLNAKTITNFSVAFEGDNAGLYTAYFRNIIYHYNSGTIGSPSYVPLNVFTSTLQTNSQLLIEGYTNVALSVVQVESKSFLVTRGPLSIGAAGIVRNSQIVFSSALPAGGSGSVETSVDNQASWQSVISGASIPNLLAGMSITGRSLYYRFKMSLGTDPTVNVGFGAPTVTINSAYNATKADVVASYTTATDFNLGTLTDLKTVGTTSTPAIVTNGFQRNWDDANYSGQTAYAGGVGTSSVVNKQFVLAANAGIEIRSRLDFAGQWQNFTAECDITIIAGTCNMGMVYRCTGWQNNNDTYAYTANVQSGTITFGRGTNSASGAGSFTSLASVGAVLAANSVHRLKVVVSGSSHTIYLDNVAYITATDTLYGPYNLYALGLTPTAYYRMDEASALVLHDSSTNAFNGTINNAGITYSQAGALTASGDSDTALLFNGSTGFATMSASINPATHTAVSVACWVKLSGTFSGTPCIMANSHTNVDHKGFQLKVNSGNTVTFEVGNGTVSVAVTTTSALVVGTWAYIVGVCDGSNMRIYFNGVQQASSAFTNAWVSNGFSIGIGYNPSYSGDFFPGTIDECAVYLSGLSALAVAAGYSNGTNNGGYIGLRTYNGTGATISPAYDNFGVCSALSGTWQSPSIALAGASTYGNSVVQWDVDGLPDSTTSIIAQTSINAGSTWQTATNGGAISGLVAGASLAGVSLLLKLTLTAANAPVVPVLNGVTAWVMGQYSASGTRVAPTLSLAGIVNASTALVNWNANLPTNTSLVVASSINSGSTWQTVATPGAAITGIAVQSAPINDVFASNSSANYTQSSFTATPTALTTYGSNVASGTLSTADQMSTTTGGTETHNTTTSPSGSGYMEMLAQGGTGTINASMPAPTGNGWLLDSTVLVGNTIIAGNWSASIALADLAGSGPVQAIIARASKRSSGGVSTVIGTMTLTSQTVFTTRTVYTFSATAFPSMSFATGDKLYIDLFIQATGWGGDQIAVYVSTSSTQGVANDLQIVTPGYTPTSTGAWTWDTANSRLVGSSATNGTLAYTAALTGADNQIIADFDQADGSGMLANYNATASGYYVQIWDASASGTPNTVKLFRRSASTNTQIGSTATISFTRGTIKRFVLNIQSGVLTVSMDGTAIITYTDGSPLGAGQSGLLLNTLARVYSLRILQYGQNVNALSLLTRCTLTSTDPTVTPQLLDMQAFVSGPDIGPGSLIPSVAYRSTFLDVNIADLNTKSNYWTYFRNNGSLIFQARTATPAPFVLSSLNSQTIAGQTINDVLVNGAELDNSGDSYRNMMTMLGAIATSTFTEIKVGDGSTQTWNVSHPLSAPPTSIILNGQGQSFGMKGIDTGKNFYYQIGSMAIDQDSGGTVLAKSDSFAVSYTGSFSQNVTLNNTALAGTITQSQMAAIENSAGGSSSGIVEAVLDVSGTPTTVAAATAQGNQLLQRYGNIGRTFVCQTLRSGLLPGMQLALFVPEFNLNNVQVLVAAIDVSIAQSPAVTGGLLYTWKLTCVEGPSLGTWVKLFTSGLS